MLCTFSTSTQVSQRLHHERGGTWEAPSLNFLRHTEMGHLECRFGLLTPISFYFVVADGRNAPSGSFKTQIEQSRMGLRVTPSQ